MGLTDSESTIKTNPFKFFPMDKTQIPSISYLQKFHENPEKKKKKKLKVKVASSWLTTKTLETALRSLW